MKEVDRKLGGIDGPLPLVGELKPGVPLDLAARQKQALQTQRENFNRYVTGQRPRPV